jgi:hypothetical protein
LPFSRRGGDEVVPKEDINGERKNERLIGWFWRAVCFPPLPYSATNDAEHSLLCVSAWVSAF